MSHLFNYDAANAARIYDRERFPMGADVIAGLLHVHCKKPLKDVHVLDAGCGTGQYTEALFEKGLTKATMIDASAEMLNVAKEKLKTAINNKMIDDVVQVQLPHLPFEDGAFDAVMYNYVLHHLDKDGSDGKIHMYQKALLEAKRVLSPHGVLIISTCLPVIIEEAFWFTQIHQYYKEKVASPLLSVEEYLAIFDRTGFECVAAMNLLATKMPSMFRNYFDSDGPLKAEWRIGTSMFESYGDQLLNEMETSFLKLKEQGKLKKFMEDHDRTAEIGMVTVFACVAKGSKTFKDLASGYP